MKVRVFHNVQRDEDGRRAGFDGYQADHGVNLVFEYDWPESDTDTALNRAFYLFNVGENDVATAYRARRLRSLSVGDVVAVGDAWFACDRAGWSPVNPPQVVNRPEPGSTPYVAER
jgi:hypothetical protein